MKKNFVFLSLMLFLDILYAQDSITIDHCYTATYNYFPIIKQKKLNSEITELKIRNIQKNFYPTLNLIGQATYQSDVVSFDIPIPNFQANEMSKDQYKMYLEANQMIYDGGLTKAQKKLEKISIAVENQNIEVQLYALKERINQVYFLIILFQEQEKILLILLDDLNNKLKIIQSGIKNGVLTQVNADILSAEILKVEQQFSEIRSGKKSSISILNEFTNMNSTSETYFQLPDYDVFEISLSQNRPEYQLFEMQTQKIEYLSELTQRKRFPTLAAFAQVGYGRPALNMMSNEFDDYYIVGARLQWNFWDWQKTKTEKQILKIQQESIDIQQETFKINQKISMQKEIDAIEKINEQITKDIAIISLREKIVKMYESQLTNGVIKTSDYVTEINALSQAKLNMEIHKIQLVQAKANYIVINGQN